jgi:serine/threonine protein phosphatase PrpC
MGGRDKNDDYIGNCKEENIQCFVVADGLGGYEGGKKAAYEAVEAALKAFRRKPEISEEAVEIYINAAQDAVVRAKKYDDRLKSMCTTIVILVTDGREAVWGNIGDSRLYHFEDTRIKEITDDHSVAFSNFLAGRCLYHDIRKSPDQNKLLRTLGNSARFDPQIYKKVGCGENDAFLLCTDGFWEYVYEGEMEDTLAGAKNTKEWMLDMLSLHRRRTPENNDNYSAIAIML